MHTSTLSPHDQRPSTTPEMQRFVASAGHTAKDMAALELCRVCHVSQDDAFGLLSSLAVLLFDRQDDRLIISFTDDAPISAALPPCVLQRHRDTCPVVYSRHHQQRVFRRSTAASTPPFLPTTQKNKKKKVSIRSHLSLTFACTLHLQCSTLDTRIPGGLR